MQPPASMQKIVADAQAARAEAIEVMRATRTAYDRTLGQMRQADPEAGKGILAMERTQERARQKTEFRLHAQLQGWADARSDFLAASAVLHAWKDGQGNAADRVQRLLDEAVSLDAQLPQRARRSQEGMVSAQTRPHYLAAASELYAVDPMRAVARQRDAHKTKVTATRRGFLGAAGMLAALGAGAAGGAVTGHVVFDPMEKRAATQAEADRARDMKTLMSGIGAVGAVGAHVVASERHAGVSLDEFHGLTKSIGRMMAAQPRGLVLEARLSAADAYAELRDEMEEFGMDMRHLHWPSAVDGREQDWQSIADLMEKADRHAPASVDTKHTISLAAHAQEFTNHMGLLAAELRAMGDHLKREPDKPGHAGAIRMAGILEQLAQRAQSSSAAVYELAMPMAERYPHLGGAIVR